MYYTVVLVVIELVEVRAKATSVDDVSSFADGGLFFTAAANADSRVELTDTTGSGGGGAARATVVGVVS